MQKLTHQKADFVQEIARLRARLPRPSKSHPQPAVRIPLVALAAELGLQRSSIHYAARRLGIVPLIVRKPAGQQGQRPATVTPAEARQILTYFLHFSQFQRPVRRKISPPKDGTSQRGFFYIIQLEPRHDPLRLKVGYTATTSQRLANFLCATPFAVYLGHWPCLRSWEKTAIAYITRACTCVRHEVFRAPDPKKVVARARAFFRQMPALPEAEAQKPTRRAKSGGAKS